MRAHYHDYALAVGSPSPEEAATAQARLNRYVARLTAEGRERLAAYEYVAMEVTTVPLSDVGNVLKNAVNAGRVSGSLASDPFNPSSARVPFIVVFSTKTLQPASNEGYVALDTPQKGKPGLFGGYDALYIGKAK